MAATGWSYFVPYEEDISAALERLKADVFARGDYIAGSGLSPEEYEKTAVQLRGIRETWLNEILEKAEQPGISEQERLVLGAGAEVVRSELGKTESIQPEPKPQTVEELLEQQGEEETHSILDIRCISPRPKSRAISPFPRAKLLSFFESEMPSHEEVEEVYEFGSLEAYVSKPCQGIYIVVYRNGVPDEIFFAGSSGYDAD